MDYSCLFPQCKNPISDELSRGRSSLLNTNSLRQLCFTLNHMVRAMSSPRITDGAGGSRLLSAVKHNDAVWSEVNLNSN